jgi:hypothetical protein
MVSPRSRRRADVWYTLLLVGLRSPAPGLVAALNRTIRDYESAVKTGLWWLLDSPRS